MNFIEFVQKCKSSMRVEIFNYGTTVETIKRWVYYKPPFSYEVHYNAGNNSYYLCVMFHSRIRFYKLTDAQVSLLLLK